MLLVGGIILVLADCLIIGLSMSGIIPPGGFWGWLTGLGSLRTLILVGSGAGLVSVAAVLQTIRYIRNQKTQPIDLKDIDLEQSKSEERANEVEVPQKRKKIKQVQIITSQGGGNGITAKSTNEAISKIKRLKKAEIKIVDIDSIWPGGKQAFGLYEMFAKYGWYHLTYALTRLGKETISFNKSQITGSLRDLITENGSPDLLISVATLLNPSLFEIAKELNVPVLVISADLDPSLYFFNAAPNDFENVEYRVCIPYEDEKMSTFLPSFIDEEKTSYVWYPLRAEFEKEYAQEEIASFKKELFLPDDKSIILVMQGSLGSRQKLMSQFRQLYSFYRSSQIQKPVHFVFLYGREESTKNYILEKAQKRGFVLQEDGHTYVSPNVSMQFSLVGFTREIYKYYLSARSIITKPGPGTISEAIMTNLPILADNSNVLMQEVYNVEFETKNNLGIAFQSADELVIALNDVLDDEKYGKMVASIKEFKEVNYDKPFSKKIRKATRKLLDSYAAS